MVKQTLGSKRVWEKEYANQLVRVLVTIVDPKTMKMFLGDALTEKEITEISSRLMAAKMLKQGSTYLEIVETTKLSSRTVARISAWLQNGFKGYDVAIRILKK